MKLSIDQQLAIAKLFQDKKLAEVISLKFKGEQGMMGKMPSHKWNGTKLQFEFEDETGKSYWGEPIELKGEKGDTGDTGEFSEEEKAELLKDVSKILEEHKKEINKIYEESETRINILESVIDEVSEKQESIAELISIYEPDNAQTLRDKLESLKDDERIDKSAIKGLDKTIGQEDLDRAISILDQRTQYLINKTTTSGGSGDALTSGALTQFVGNNTWKVWYSDGSGDVQELALGADGTFLKSNGASSAPSFATPAGSGDVSKVGTPVNNQVGVWTGDGTLEGDTALTFDTTTDTLTSVNFAGNLTGNVTGDVTGNVSGNAGTVTNATLTTALTVNTGTVTLTGNVANTSALTIGAGAVSVSGTNTGDQTITNSSDATSHTVTLSASGGSLQLIEGTNITLTTGGTASAGTVTITASGGSGDVTKVGTPANNQMAVWTGDGTLEGTSDFTYDGTSLNLITGKNFQIAGTTILTDVAGSTTLSGIDALDATTEATIEGAIDTLANLTSVQGQTLTLAGAFITSGANSLTLTTTGATNVTLPTSGTLAVLGGNTFTGVHDFGGATSLEVPNGAGGTTVDTTGEICVDTTSDTLNFYDGTVERVLTPVMSKSITIESPTASEDLSMFYSDEAITITKIVAVLVGSSTPSVTWTVRHGTDRSAAGAEVVTGGTTTTSTTTGSVVTSFNDATVIADSFLWIETTAQSGTVGQINITVFYTQDA